MEHGVLYLPYSGVVLSLLRTSTQILRQVMAGGGMKYSPLQDGCEIHTGVFRLDQPRDQG
jgi:hypothetical protein